MVLYRIITLTNKTTPMQQIHLMCGSEKMNEPLIFSLYSMMLWLSKRTCHPNRSASVEWINTGVDSDEVFDTWFIAHYGIPNPYPIMERYIQLYDEGGTEACPEPIITLMVQMSIMLVVTLKQDILWAWVSSWDGRWYDLQWLSYSCTRWKNDQQGTLA